MKTDSVELRLAPEDNRRLANLCGPMDENLRQVEAAFDVTISRRGASFRFGGDTAQAEKAGQAIEYFYNRAHDELSLDDIQLGLVELTRARSLGELGAEEAGPALRTRRADLRARTPRQGEYIEQIRNHDITFGIGPAGTGKTYLAVACAVDALEREQVKRLVLTRPAVEAGERLGFLPGDLTQKVDPYLRPLYDALYDLMGFDKVTRLIERHAIEVAPLAFMRGRTLNHAFIILDEAQNTTPEQMQMFLTRIGFGARAVVTGDPTQIDLPKHVKSGLMDAAEILSGVRGLAFTHFLSEDVVRHPLVGRIVDAYAARRAETEARGKV
ncbi:PhoH family protein [Thiobacillus sp.]|uniref:PhoH family protein n=1 Tax=Thiobacillus sp. TaxID=924 RepID=UPI0025FE12E9|nr:PhoH family protein [Thiobacillus sp.]MBT9538724.1 PhoH family protein [Thiobacillus sp.]